jgi:hypothetical protein
MMSYEEPIYETVKREYNWDPESRLASRREARHRQGRPTAPT